MQTLGSVFREREMNMSYFELLSLSSQAHRVHHGDEDGDIPQRAAHAPRYTDPQRVMGPLSELHCPGLLMLLSCEGNKHVQ